VRVGLIGRTRILLDTARRVQQAGNELAFLYTTTPAGYEAAGVEDFERFGADQGVPVFADNQIADRADELSADICLSLNWLTLLPQRFLDGFPHGVLNAHAGDLPRYRGNATLAWAILNGEREACLTIHRMVEELDAGPILLQRRRPIDETTDVGDLFAWLEREIPDAFVEALDQVRRGTAVLRPQDDTVRPLRAYPRKPEDGRIDWSASTEQVMRLVRASSRPFAGAFSFLEDGTRVTIFRARPHDPGHDFLAVPGQVCLRVDGNPVIATGDGMIELVEVDGGEDVKRAISRSLRNRLV
jgi:methionyl-tRNA formyltransferase